MRRSIQLSESLKRQQHGVRVLLLIAFTGALYAGLAVRAEVTSSESLRAIESAQAIRSGDGGHFSARAGNASLHALAILAAHTVVPGSGPERWEGAAQVVSVLAGMLLAVPVYLVAVELFESSTAWLGTALFLASPLMGYVVANLLSDSVFLLFWTWGLWSAIRFLRDGRWIWLPLFVASATGAASLRLDGGLLALCFWAVVGIMPWGWAAPVERCASWPVFCLLSILLVALVSPVPGASGQNTAELTHLPVVEVETATATGPSIQTLSFHRDETPWEFWRRSIVRMLKVMRNAVSLRLLPLALLGLVLAWSGAAQARVWLLLCMLVVGGLGLLIERRASVGDCSMRDAVVPGLLLVLAAGHGLGWLARRVRVEGLPFDKARVAYHPGPLLWLVVLGVVVVVPNFRSITPADPRGSFGPYRNAAAWLGAHGVPRTEISDLTGWTTFQMAGGATVRPSSTISKETPRPRWLVVRQGQVLGHSAEHAALVAVVGDRTPVARFPASRQGLGLEVRIYNLDSQSAPPVPPLHAVGKKNRTVADLRLISDEKQSNVKH
ncbi:MAG: glycosyltransferase family 39 protein [Isosphaeraceae bacterium]|nr:glycosyltransferase family 39 protein [Isosphaeraceae bacterium]